MDEQRIRPQITVNEAHDETLTRGDLIADKITALIGSWRFILVQSCILCVWICLNVSAFLLKWDPYPFILLNLCLSFQAAYSAPFVMMSQNRQAAKDRLMAEHDFQINQAAEREIQTLLEAVSLLRASQEK